MPAIKLLYQYCDINLRATLGEGGGRMWPPGLQLPTPALSEGLFCFHPPVVENDAAIISFVVGIYESISTDSMCCIWLYSNCFEMTTVGY